MKDGAAALALDLGTTRLKLARWSEARGLEPLAARDAPRPAGPGSTREVDPEAWRAAVDELLSEIREDLPLGIASQRSSFLLWERAGGRPRTPIVSWQDRSAAEWCERHPADGPRVTELTGLLLSPHYAGPKLAALFDRDRGLRAAAHGGELAFGTLETWLTSLWSDGRAHETDLSMAARTALVGLRDGEWSEELLALFDVPRGLLPAIVPTAGRSTALGGGRTLTASLSDQASGALALLPADEDCALVNFGTGTFVLRPTGEEPRTLPGYLTGPLLGEAGGRRHALEGTINGGGATAERQASGPTLLPADDPRPGLFCLPDENGLGAPHWDPRRGLSFSDPRAGELPGGERRRLVLEGLAFRVREILEDLGAAEPATRILVAGGLTRDPFVAEALASTLGRPVEVTDEPEATLLGAARLAAGVRAQGESATRRVDPAAAGGWLRSKFEGWSAWLAAQSV